MIRPCADAASTTRTATRPAPIPPVEQQDEELSSSARTHLRTLHGQDLARPAGTGGGIVFVLLVAIAALIVLTALAATGHL
ncbi:MAG: hypothetical protein R2736_21060 [Solirubrobacterales bacterium]